MIRNITVDRLRLFCPAENAAAFCSILHLHSTR